MLNCVAVLTTFFPEGPQLRKQCFIYFQIRFRFQYLFNQGNGVKYNARIHHLSLNVQSWNSWSI